MYHNAVLKAEPRAFTLPIEPHPQPKDGVLLPETCELKETPSRLTVAQRWGEGFSQNELLHPGC